MKKFKALSMYKMCQCYVYYPLNNFIKSKAPPPPFDSPYSFPWLFSILYNNVNNITILILTCRCYYTCA